MTPTVLTVEEVAAILRIGRTAAYDAVRRGDIPSVRLGRTVRVPRHALNELLGHDGHQNGFGRSNPAPAEEHPK